MNTFFQELENLEEHFRRTSTNTLTASQVSNHEYQMDEEPADGVVNLEKRVM
jgi:hypothetical protein